MTSLEDIYELSPMQEGMLFHTQYSEGSGVYCEQLACALDGDLDEPAFRNAWEQVVERHPVLRTAFHWEGLEKPVQVVLRQVEVPWKRNDWLGLSPAEQEECLDRFLAEDRRRGFVLDQAPLLRLALFRTGEASHRFVLTFHHLLMDGWCLPAVIMEVLAFYEAARRGQAVRIPRPRPYRDFILWLQSRSQNGDEAFWRRMLAGFRTPTPLPAERGMATIHAGEEASADVYEALSAAESAGANALARTHQLTVNTLVQAAWGLLLSRTSGEPDVVFGATVSGRPASLAGVESMVGLFINTLPVRVLATPEELLLPWLDRLQGSQAEAREHEQAPLPRIQGWSEIPQGQPLFESILVFENRPIESASGQEQALRIRDARMVEQNNYPLTLVAVPGSTLRLRAIYDRRRMAPDSVARMLGHLRTLLTAMSQAGRETRLGDLPILTAAERHQLVLEWNDEKTRYPAACVHELFAAQARKTPEAVAVSWGEMTLTYRELELRSNRLANHLRRLGIGAGMPVAIYLEPSPDTVVATLATLKAGGFYLPLDPSYPQERLAFIVEDVGARLLITREPWLGLFPGWVQPLCLDRDAPLVKREADSAPVPGVTPEGLAYVIYTSGSTGRPKGVQVTHANVARLFAATEERFGFGPGDVWTFFHSVAFDFSVWEIWGALLYGGRLVVVSHQVARSPEDFHALLATEAVTVLNQTPSAFQQLSAWEQEAPEARELSLRLVIFGGEALNVASLRPWFERHGDVRPQLVNMYGITETTVHVTFRPVSAADLERGSSPIGRPVSDLRLHLLAAQGTLVPVGVPGEIHVGGAGLARGYLGRPALTAERFVPDPLSNGAGERLYRSGDLARRQPDGSLEYLGRIDHQVKIRGFRIELGEIESVLVEQAGVREAVVVAREDTGGWRLVAYVGGDAAADELRRALRERLPDYMIPAVFVTLAALPLTPNGKVDRKALPAPEQQSPRETYQAPRTPVEEVLCGIWAEMLGLERVGAADSFFDLGGHSLLATRVISRLRSAFGVEMPLRALFEAPKLADLAARVEAEQRIASTMAPVPPLAAVPREGDPPLSFAQERLWLIDQLEPGSPLYNVPVALGARGPLAVRALAHCLGEIARRHEALRTVFAVRNGAPVQVIRPAEPFLLPVVDLSGLPAGEREALALALAGEEASRPFDLARDLPVRGLLLRLAGEDHVLALTLHHIASDGWSMGILVREVMALYPAFAEGRPSPLPELPVQYADFALWQRSWLHGEVLESEIAFWRRQLAGLPQLLELPTDRPRPATQSYRGATRPVRMPAELTRRAEALGRREGATLFMVLLAGFQALLARYSGQDDLAVGTPVAGRNREEIEGLIGFFINTLVLRGSLAGEPTFLELLGRARETALAAYLHQDVPFEKLVQELAPERSPAHAPLFQVMLVLQNAPAESLEVRDLHLRPVYVEDTTAKFDLTINVGVHGGWLTGGAKHSTDLFDATTIDRLLLHYERLLAAVLTAPDLPVSELPLLTEAESHQLREWGGVAQEPRTAAPTLHGGFEARARRAPEAPALTFEGTSLSYGELNRRANQLARWLRRHGVGPESRVGLCMERSLDLVVGILGILKAGGAYVPLDPGYPRERLAYMIEDAKVEVVVGMKEPAAALPDGTLQILLDTQRELLEKLPSGDLQPSADGASLAYVIYTSGSTGQPKGALVTHGNVARLFAATDSWFGFAERDVWTLFHSYAFDFSVWEIWGALLYGGRLVIVPWEVSRAPGLFLDLLLREGVTVLNQTPSAFVQLARVDEERGGPSTGLRLVIFGGEALDPAVLAPWFARHGDARPVLVNMYGITETTVHATYRPLRAADALGERRSVIGVPLPDLSLAVLDRALQPAPLGVPGELAIGGAGLARGYLGRPELTAERFIPDPAGGARGARLYRSGDLGRFLPHGEVEYLGRIDHQVKIRGFRIELGEIEAALSSLPGVSQAAVLLREDTPGNPRLVAYVAGDAGDDDTLRRPLRERLPEYMVPAAFVRLPALPLTPNGKLDRKALPAPEGRSGERGPLAPRTPLERFLAGLWSDALGGASVGVHDSFFDLGGNSLTGVILVNRLQRELGQIVHVVALFDAPTVAKMAAYLAREHRDVIARFWGAESLGEEVEGPGATARRVGAEQVAAIRALIRPLAPLSGAAAEKNPRAVFVLSPPRSGSTLLRVMLGGHPQLFAPPELELLSFNTMAQREAAFPGRDSFWLEGAVRAVMELRGCDAEEAQKTVARCVGEGFTTQRFYRQLQEWLGPRILVDKTPSYALDPAILRRAEEAFEKPFYVHLVRHPYAVIRSFEEAKLDELFFRHPHPFGRTELAELIWLVSHQNIAEHLAGVPAQRQLEVRFEDLVRDPEAELRRICTALEIDFHPAMADPYRDRQARMTDGIHAGGRMLGDVKFHQYRGVERKVAERWREAQEDLLGEPAWEMAVRFGYERPAPLPAAVIPRAGREEPLPLSFAQQRLWFIDQLEPGSPLYNIPVALRAKGPLDGAVLAFTLGEIVRRHEALRTVFSVRDGMPVQRIRPARFLLPVVDLSGLPESRREALTLSLVGEEAARPFDLTRGLMLRSLLLRLAESDHAVVLTMHHIVSDGWSMGILIREVAALYPAFAARRPSPLSELPVQYADFAVWQRSWLQGEVLEQEIAFWRRQLAGLPPLLELPTDRPRPAVLSYRGAARPMRIPAGLTGQGEALGRREGATLFMVLLAAFQPLLARYSGQDDFAVGTPVAGRNRVELEGLIGFFVNTLVLRSDLTGRLSGGLSFRELLGRVRETALAAYLHQDVPFEKLVEELASERSLTYTPLFQVMLALQNAPVESLEIRDLHLQPVGMDGMTAKFDLELSLVERNGELTGSLEYATDLFDAATIEHLIAHYERLLAAAVAMPERTVSELPLLSPAEHHQLIAEWNDTAVALWKGELLHHLFEAQAASTPDAPAVAFEGETLTYAALDARAGRLARHLRELGCGPESRVGVALERTPNLLVALLGVLKCGAVYVPLDPQYPRERLAFLLESSHLSALLSQESLLDHLPIPAGLPVVMPSAAEAGGEIDPGELEDLGGHCLAYIIYTSGSTGRPKGAMVTHAGMINHLWAKVVDLGLERHSRVAQTASQSFDISIWQFLAPLLVGGSVQIAGQETVQDPELLLRFVVRERITVLEVVPSLLSSMLASLEAPGGTIDLSSLQWMIVTGEACAPDLADRWLALAPHTRLLNAYGPTECSDDVTHYVRVRPDASSALTLPIGRPVANTQIYVLDPAGQPTAQGIPGELFVGGAGVGRGYLGEGARTAQVFLPDPFASRPGQRLYNTGDLARWRTDGWLEFLGRVDHQVKIRGHRIELGEIETVLASQKEVRTAVVTAREDTPGQARLVAYVVPRRNEGPDRDRVDQWELVFDEIYGTGQRSERDAGVNLRVWISSYTGAPLPESEIVECFEDSVARILALHPRRVLEIGCGTGLLLLRIAPHCAAFTGTDISDEALRSLRERIEERSDLPRVDLLHRAADDFTGIPPGSFDVVVLNEVAQYFPSAEYLVRVVEGAVAATAPGGTVFLGGLRSFPLLEAFHTSVELARSPADRRLGEVREAARRRLAQDKELAVDPALFEALARSLPWVAGLSIQLKGGRARNELTCFRYDVILRVAGGAEPPLPGEPRHVAWEEGWTLDELRRALAEGPEDLAVRGVPNARLLADLAAFHRICDGSGPGTAGELRGEISETADGVEPADLWDLAAESGREAEVQWSADRPERLDILFHRPGTRPPWPFQVNRADGPWSRYANRPDRGAPEGLWTRLRDFASERLPGWMIPSAWVLLDELPLTPNGKLDRKALPAPEQQNPRESYLAPRTPVEEVLAGMWAELLGLERVGAAESFFDLGGHSLLATRVISRLRSAFDIEMPLRDLFEAPTVASLAVRVEALRRAGSGRTVPPLVPVPREGPLPLSFAQQRLWFLHQMDPLSPVYNMPFDFRLSGPLDVAALAAGLTEVVRRHETLRTTLTLVDGDPRQVIAPATLEQPLPVVDLSALPLEAREALALRLGSEESARPFDLARLPVVRTLLLRLAESEHVLLFTIHHVSGDGWSDEVLSRELVELYRAAAEGSPALLPDLPVQYADFAVWQRSWLQGEVLDEQIEYWRRQLAGAPPLLEMPLDRPRPPVQSFRGQRSRWPIRPELSGSLLKLGRGHGATGFMTLLAGFQALLYRYSGQESVVVGTPIANREQAELQKLIGFFTNTLALRADFSGDPGFAELLGRVRETALGAYAHQDLPFEKLVDELAPQRHMSYAPVFQALFVYHNAPQRTESLRDLSLQPFGPDQGIARFDLTLVSAEMASGLGIYLDSNADLFEEATASRMLRLFVHLLAQVTEDPQRAIGELALLDEEEHRQVVLACNETARARAEEELCLHGLFERQAALTPEAPAVAGDDGVVSYGELAGWAGRIADRLAGLGVGADDRVGVCLERSAAALAAMLGTLRAGAAYVPLDPEWPRERLAAVAADAGLTAMLTRSGLTSGAGLAPCEVWVEEARHGAPSDLPGAPPASAEAAAYIIYTSGSTGVPKGVVISHRAAANFVLALGEMLELAPADRLLLFAPLSFDASVLQIFPPLSRGAAVVVHADPRALAGAELPGFCERHGVTVLDLPAALWRQWIEDMAAEGRALPVGIRTFLTGGESVPAERVRTWAGLTRRHAAFLSSYGPTEATVTAAVFRTDSTAAASLPPGKVPVGRPLANVRTYVLDARMQPVPAGVAGELYLAGDGLARGYLGRPELTAAAFLPDAHGGARGGRLYRTGDLARRLPGGDLEFLGRADTQVKIRGFRLELSEVETVLRLHPDLAECVATVREDRPEDHRLVAYVVPQPGREPGVPELRSFMAERLPQHMVPSTVVVLSALPVLASGKVDRAALPAPEHQSAEETWRAPRTPVEEVLAGIWAELLGIERAGTADDFFDLGGHSLLATQVMSRVRGAFGVEVPLRDFFEAPTLAELAARVEAALREGSGLLVPPLLPMAPTQREGRSLPLSFAQQRLWFIDQLEPDSPLYNIPVALRVEGPLRTEVLALCLGEITRRHEALRTVFPATEGSPAQVVQPAKPFRMALVDLSGLPRETREMLALTLAGQEASRPFHLGRGPLLRGMLLRLAGEDHVAALTMHHIVSDGWSVGILVREVTALYAAIAEGRPSPLPELPVQYADFAAWQASWLHGETLEGEISYWRRQLAGLPPQLELPTDRPRPAVQSFRGASRPVLLPAELNRQAHSLGRREGATLFMVLLAGFQALLARTSGQQDLAVGTPVAGRNRVETEDLIGFFVNTLVLRGDLTDGGAGEPSFRELLRQARETALEAHTHQDVPFEKLVQELSPERSLAHTPLFQVVLALQNAPVGAVEIRDLSLRPVSLPEAMAKFDLILSLEESNGQLAGAIEYATDLFDATTVDRLILQYERLLAAALAEPERRAGELPLLPAAERHQVLVEWNDTAVERGDDAATLIQEPFEAWARRAPDAVAILWRGEALTYGTLEERANRLAHRLAHLGAGPGSLIGIHLRRGPGMIVAVLAVLKAGAAYVPLETGHPPARLRWIIDTLEISCVITETAQQDSLPALPHLIFLDQPEPADPIGRISRHASPDDLAYIIFTSGSTGTPKGVMVRHRPVINLLRWAYRAFAFSPEDRVLFVTALSFDLSVFDIFGLLGAGGSIRIADEEEIRDPERLLRALAEEPITFWDSAPAALEQTVPFLASVLDGLNPQAPPALRLVFLSGDWIPVTLPDRIRERFSGARIVALGGATEATVWSNVFPVERVEPSWTSIPYGRPIEAARYHVLDAWLAPCAVGVPGDLYIGGDCLADGYAREPVLTAHKFLPDPWSATPGKRLYRTGDRARYRPDGNLEFLGRLDHQVKIRGFRIELGEIEAALSSIPGVREAVAIVREDRSETTGLGERRLVAYLAGDVSAMTAEDLRRSLRERLPDYMVPAAFVKLAALPLTPNGKVDRKALPAPERQSSEESWIAPRTPVEEVLAGIWADLLDLDHVGADGNFFDLGGHSLLATQVVSRVRGTLGIEMPLRDLFEAPILADLAIRGEAALRSGTDRPTPPLVRMAEASRYGDLPLSFAQQRLWFIDQLEPGNPVYNMSVALRAEGPLRSEVLALCLSEIVRRHETLRTVFAEEEGSPVQRIQAAEPFRLAVVDLSGLPEGPRRALALTLAGEEADRPFDLTCGPLLRGMLVRLSEGDHVIALNMHHIVSDGWSMGVLIREVTALYEAFAAGRPSPLPELAVQYADFAVWQRSWLRGDILEEEMSFWRHQLAGLPPLLALPTDRPRPAVQSYRGAERPVRLSAELTRQATALARREGATLFMVLLATLQVLLARYSGQRDLAVGTPVAARNRMEIEDLIGFFLNMLVLRGNLAGELSFQELLAQVRETALSAYLHQDLPFEKLVDLTPERTLAHSPLFQVMLMLQNVPAGNLEIRELRMRPVSVEGTTAKYDLMLSLAERGGILAGAFEYATDLFDAATIDRLTGHFERLLTAVVTEPGRPVFELPVASEAELFQILVEWNHTGPASEPRAPVHELFRAQVRRTPEAVAVVFGDEELTYAELAARAGCIAGRLRRLGVGPDVLVGLLAERSLDMIAGVLGILEAGGAYVPLDPRYPAQRLAFLLDDTRSRVMLTQSHLCDHLPAEGVEILLLDGDGDIAASGGAVLSEGEPVEENLAYVIYTSGSTGQPKGVALSHGALRNLIDWHLATLVRGVRTLQFASLSFDASFHEMFACWGSGGTLVVVPEEQRRDLLALAELLVEQRIEKAILPVVVLTQLAEIYAGRQDLPPLREIITTGERLQTNRALAALLQRLPGCTLHNHYGPSETHVATAFTLSPDPEEWAVYPSIGRPIRSTSAYVVDPGLVPAPVGVPGELCLGGACLARGYLERPGLTAERFIPDLFGQEPGGRLYRTGDKVRLLPSGDLEYLGRIDDQVKIRGFRIEPGEIEETLVALPGVREAVVVAREDKAGDRRLVAYIVGDAATDTLRRSLRERLPDYMMPAAFVTLAELPLTPNGKVDHKALPAPEWRSAEQCYLAPRTPVEEVLAGIWAELLGTERVGAADHFFDLGGHSLLGAQLRSRVREAWGVVLPLRALFERPVLADLATEIEALRSNA